MPVPATINDLSTTAGANYPAGTESPSTIDDYLRAHASFIATLRDGKVGDTGDETIAGVKTFSSTIVGNVSGNAGSATNLAGGSAGTLPYQTGSGATAQLAAGTSGFVLRCNGAAAPSWTAQSAIDAGSVDGKSFGTFGAAGGILYATSTSDASATVAGTSGQVLLSGGAGAPTWAAQSSLSVGSATTATSATSANNISGGAAGAVPYQSGSGATALLAAGTSGQMLQCNGAAAPSWVNQSTLTAGNVSGVVAVANGGTGQATAAGAFNAIKQDATTSATGVVELATNAELQAGTDATRAVTPAALFSALDRSLGGNGYQKLPGGLIIQWGFGNGSTSGGVAVSFPISFPTNCAAVTVTHGNNGSSLGSAKTYSIGLGGFSVALSTDDGSNVVAYLADSFRWIAIGY